MSNINSTTAMSLSVASCISKASIQLSVTTVAVRHLPTDDMNIICISVIATTLLWTVYVSCINDTSIASLSISSIRLYVAVIERCMVI